jgi:hypothetical protein
MTLKRKEHGTKNYRERVRRKIVRSPATSEPMYQPQPPQK